MKEMRWRRDERPAGLNEIISNYLPIRSRGLEYTFRTGTSEPATLIDKICFTVPSGADCLGFSSRPAQYPC